MSNRAPRSLPVLLALLALGGCRDGSADDPPDVDDDEVVYADVYPAIGRPGSVRIVGRLVAEEREDLDRLDDATPLSQWSQEELEEQAFEVRLAGHRIEGRTDGEGWFSVAALGLDLPPGEHEVAIGPRGSDEVWGRARARVLPETDPPVVVTSDIDLTYLITDFRSKSGLASLLRQRAAERVPFPGAPELYRALAGDRPVVFVSGSPRAFKRTLEARLRTDAIPASGLFLKDFTGHVTRFQFDDLTEQVGYKLEILLAQRCDLPAAVREILIGDDSEADFVVYSLYRDFLAGTIPTPEALDERLAALEIPSRSRTRIVERARALEPRPAAPPVVLSLIRRSGSPGDHYRLDEYLGPDLIATDDSLQMALVLADRGHLDAAAVATVLQGMLASGASAGDVRRAAEAARDAGLFRAETLDALEWPR